jgi:hypothetical protein
MIYKKKKGTSTKVEFKNSQKYGGHKFARSGMKNDSVSGSLNSLDIRLMSSDEPKKVYAQGGVHNTQNDPEFNTTLEAYSKKYGIDKDWVNRLIALESRGDSSVKSKVKGSTASGLIQMIDKTARGLGTTAEDLRKMTPSEQLPYAFKYWNQYKGKIKQPSDLYIANMLPDALGKPDDYRLPSKYYSGNSGIDKEKKGYITVADVRKHFDPSYNTPKTEPLSLIAPKQAVADKTSMPQARELFPIQRTTLPSLEKPQKINYNTGTRPASEGIHKEEIDPQGLMSLYDNPDLATNSDFISNLFKKK